MAVLFSVLSIVGIAFLALSGEGGEVCNGIENVSIGEQPQCRLYSADSNAFVFSKKATAYQYRIADGLNLETEMRNSSFTYEETVDSESFVVFKSSHGAGGIESRQVAHFRYQLSSYADILVLDNINYEVFVHGDPIIESIAKQEHTLNWEFTYNGTEDIHVVVNNTGSRNVKISEDGWIFKTVYKMDATKALNVCSPDQECEINDTTTSVFILDYQGVERTVPVTMLYQYGPIIAFIALGSLYLVLGVFVGIVGIFAFIRFCQFTGDVEEAKTQTSNAAVVVTPSGTSPRNSADLPLVESQVPGYGI